MSLLLAKHYLILTDAEGKYLDAASFPGAAGMKGQMKAWQTESAIHGKKGRQVVQFKQIRSLNLDEPLPTTGKKKVTK